MIGYALGPEEAYRFARGEEVKSSHWPSGKLQRPLDFLVVSDHAENLGLAPQIADSNPELLKSAWGRKVHDLVKAGEGLEAYNEWGKRHECAPRSVKGNARLHAQDVGAGYGRGGKVQRAGSVHRLHRLRMDLGPGRQQPSPQYYFPRRQGARPIRSFRISYDTEDPEEPVAVDGRRTRRKPAARLLAIPHNGNLSNGPDVRRRDADDQEAARPRLCRAPYALGAALRNDADERRRRNTSGALAQRRVRQLRALGQRQLRARVEDARHAAARIHARGLQARVEPTSSKLGVNPFKFGFVGSTDSHTALATTQEDNFFGKVGRSSRRPIRSASTRSLPAVFPRTRR